MHLYFLKSHSLICKAMDLGLILRFSRIFPRLVTIYNNEKFIFIGYGQW